MDNSEMISQQLKEAVQAALDAGWSVHALANAAEIPPSGLQFWISGKRQGIKLDTAAKLAAFFGQRLTAPKIPKPPADVMPQKGPAKKKHVKKRKS